jgi:hypothetical protein
MVFGSDRGVLTMAYGSEQYKRMAQALARSLMLHSPEVPRSIVTDSPDDPQLKQLFQSCIPLNAAFGPGYRHKIHLDKYTPFRQTLFIDCDSLVVADINRIWRQLGDVSFGVPGIVRLERGDSDPEIDIDYVRRQFNVDEIWKFNSGMLYFDCDARACAVFSTARELVYRRSELMIGFHGYTYQGDNIPDEPLFTVAMAIHGITPVTEAATTLMLTPAGLQSHLEVDVINGVSEFNKHGTIVRPAIIHFAGPFSKSFEYLRECHKLEFMNDHRIRRRIGVAWLQCVASRSLNIQRRLPIRAEAGRLKRSLVARLRRAG